MKKNYHSLLLFIVALVCAPLCQAQLSEAVYRGGSGQGWSDGLFTQGSLKIYHGGAGDGWDQSTFSIPHPKMFNGGIGDGWHQSGFAQKALDIFIGGSGDGWDREDFNQALANIFTGGRGDGWDNGSSSQFATDIFTGGSGDGWDVGSFAQAALSIYTGGAGDGWSADEYTQLLMDIYRGGRGDGWASTLRPEGPLPLTLLSFDAHQEGSTVALNWITASEQNTAYFEIERSDDGDQFKLIGKVNALGASQSNQYYDFIDTNPIEGNNLYRLKMVDLDGSYVYSNVVLVRIAGDAMKIMAFPNPVREVVNLKLSKTYDHKIPCQIYDAGGKLVFTGTIPEGNNLQQFNIEHLAQGTYIIRLILPDGEQRAIKIVK